MLETSNTQIDHSIVNAASRLSGFLSTLPADTDPDTIARIIESVADELGGHVIFDLRAGIALPETVHWVGLKFTTGVSSHIVHVVVGDGPDPYWVGLDHELPPHCADLARDLLLYADGQGIFSDHGHTISGSIH